MIILVFTSEGKRKMLLSLRQRDAAINAEIHLNEGSFLRLLDGSELENVGAVDDPRIPPTLEEFDLQYPNQPAIVK